MQLPRACDPPHTPSTDAGPSTDAFSRIDYCNSVLHGVPSSTIQKLQRIKNNAAHIVLQAPRRSDVNSLQQTLHWLPVEQRINYKLAVLTFKTQQTSSPQYLNQHISLRTSARNTRSSSVPLLCVPFQRTSFARQSFSTAAPLTWYSLSPAVLTCDPLFTFKSRLKTHLFSTTFC